MKAGDSVLVQRGKNTVEGTITQVIGHDIYVIPVDGEKKDIFPAKKVDVVDFKQRE